MSFCVIYSVVLENHSVPNSPWVGGRGSISSSRSNYLYVIDLCLQDVFSHLILELLKYNFMIVFKIGCDT